MGGTRSVPGPARAKVCTAIAGAGITVLLGLVLVLASCASPSRPDVTIGTTPGGAGRTGPPVQPGTPTPTGHPLPTQPPRQPAPTSNQSFPEATALPCAGSPSADQVIALLRRTSGLLAPNATATAQRGPLCSGTWQYTVVSVSGQDPLEVISRGSPSALQLVAAGTDVCTVTVRTTAPAGIRLLARCPTTGT